MKIPCDYCGEIFECYPKRYNTSKHHCCSVECMTKLQKELREKTDGYLNCTCPICGKKFHLKKYARMRTKNACCSMECANELRKVTMTGKSNHQFGLKGNKNSSWKSDVKYKLGYKWVRVLDHPFATKGGFVLEHRLVAEKYLLTEDNSIEIDGKKYLKREYVVHHIDMCRLNNSVENLQVMTKGEHSALHCILNPRGHDSLGRFV